MRGLRALIFDVDGTISETEEVHRAAFNVAFKQMGLPWVWDQDTYRELMTVSGGRERIRHYAETRDPERVADIDAMMPDLHARKTALYAKMVDDRQARLRPGVERLLEEANSQGLKLALVTTTSIANAEALVIANLEVSGLENFDAIVGGDQVSRRKPDPEIYELALSRLGVHPRNCIAFEDTENGLRAATAAGLRTIVTPSFYTQGQDFTGAFALLSHLGDAFEPYEHYAGAGENDRMVSIPALRRWMDDDDDLRSLLTIGGRSVY